MCGRRGCNELNGGEVGGEKEERSEVGEKKNGRRGRRFRWKGEEQAVVLKACAKMQAGGGGGEKGERGKRHDEGEIGGSLNEEKKRENRGREGAPE